MDKVYMKMNDDIEVVDKRIEESKIRKFYAGKTVFLTGSTGFMGKTLVEKLLRGCPDLKCIYVMIRPKKGLSVEERMKKYFTDVLFDTLRKVYPDFESKVHAFEGDLVTESLGLSEKDKNIIIEETNIIFHIASNVKFNERISLAGNINVLGTARIIELAMKCKNVEGFMYVSTAYSHCYRLDIKEEVYPPPADLNMIKNLIATDKTIPTGLSQTDIKSMLGEYPNTYTYTKAVAEGLVTNIAKQAPFPCIIFRPSVVLSSWKEPIRGWTDNLNGPSMLLVGYGLGIVHVGCEMHCIMDYIPVDMAINAVIVTMWDAVKNRPMNSDVVTYNCGSSTVKPISIGHFRKSCLPSTTGEILDFSVYTAWRHFIIETDCIWYFYLCHILFHFIPFIFIDGYLLATGKKPMALSAFKKMTVMFSLVTYFWQREWMIDITETMKAVDRMNSVDRDLFFCDVREIDWADYCLTFWRGLRVYILKDPMATAPAGLRKYRRLQFLHNTLLFALLSLAVYFIVTRLGLL